LTSQQFGFKLLERLNRYQISLLAGVVMAVRRNFTIEWDAPHWNMAGTFFPAKALAKEAN
jgi:hypothetical protein